jgi:chemotaxis response regulator CheB
MEAATNGTLGAEAIKAEGGIAFAQDEKDAKILRSRVEQHRQSILPHIHTYQMGLRHEKNSII